MRNQFPVEVLLVAVCFSTFSCRPRTLSHSNLKRFEAEASSRQDISAISDALFTLASQPTTISFGEDPSAPIQSHIRHDDNGSAWFVRFDGVKHLQAEQKSTLETLMRVPFPPHLADNATMERMLAYLGAQAVWAEDVEAGDDREYSAEDEDVFLEFIESAKKRIAKLSSACANQPEVSEIEFRESSGKATIIACFLLRDNIIPKLTPTERLATFLYTEGSAHGGHYQIVNQVLRSRSFLKPSFRTDLVARTRFGTLLTLALLSVEQKASAHAAAAQLYRGVSGFYPSCDADAQTLPPKSDQSRNKLAHRICTYYHSLKNYRDCAFMSTSLDRTIAEGFTKDLHVPSSDPGILYAMSGVKGIPMSALSKFSGEKEVLVSPGKPFQIKKVQIVTKSDSATARSIFDCNELKDLTEDQVRYVRVEMSAAN